ncbi:MAG: hypothetical protein KAS72_12790 [Phycisphaerales bacterium]|nr:hypothetical protein [Phycisphaerales bacterium]
MTSLLRTNGDTTCLLDRRRREHAEITDRILHRCSFLERDDRALLESIYSDHVPIVRLAAVRQQSPRQLRRHVRRLIERLLEPRTAFVISRRDRWNGERWAVARSCLICGRDLRGVAKDLGLSLHRVRKHVDAVRALCEETRV